MNRIETIGDCTLYLGDCREILPTLGKVDAVVTDPPYGIGFRWSGAKRNGRAAGLDWKVGRQPVYPEWSDIIGDDAPFDPSPWLGFNQVILWGGNNYTLPPSRCWLVWDKRREKASDDHGDCELAWTNLDSVIRCHRQVWRGIVREGEENVVNGSKVHPAQKPVDLMQFCVCMTSGDVLDPFMGSGTTGVACSRLGRKFIGIEIEPKYFEIACRRIADEVARPQLPLDKPVSVPEQESWTEMWDRPFDYSALKPEKRE